MKRKPFQVEDDGRVICDMNVDGTPWYNKNLRQERVIPRKSVKNQQMTRAESWRYVWYSTLAVLLVGSVFAATWVLFILFCT
ncbi:MAG: hypothetical protein B5M51_08225, partial [Anaerolinea sp. 4484_236]